MQINLFSNNKFGGKYNDKAVERLLDYLEDQGVFEGCCPGDIGLKQMSMVDCNNQSSCKPCWQQALTGEPKEDSHDKA